MDKLEAMLGIPEDKDDFVIEIYTDESSFGEIERKEGKLILKIFNHSKRSSWNLDVEDFYKLLKKAKFELKITDQ